MNQEEIIQTSEDLMKDDFEDAEEVEDIEE